MYSLRMTRSIFVVYSLSLDAYTVRRIATLQKSRNQYS